MSTAAGDQRSGGYLDGNATFALFSRPQGRGLHSSTSQLNLRRFVSVEATITSNKTCSRQAGKWTGVAHK